MSIENLQDSLSHKLRVKLFDRLEINQRNYRDSGFSMNPDINISLVNELIEAMSVLNEINPWMGKLYKSVVDDIWVTCYNGEDRFLGGASTTYELLGLILMSLRPEGKFSLIEQVFALAHELGHTVLYLYQAGMVPIERSDWSKWVYSGIRKVERPSYASLHGAVALGYMLQVGLCMMSSNEFTVNEKVYISDKLEEYKSGVALGCIALRELKLTELGLVVVSELEELITLA